MARRWRVPKQPRSRRFEPLLTPTETAPLLITARRASRIAPPRRGHFIPVPPPQVPVPTWIPPLIVPARRATHPALHRSHWAAAPLGSSGPHETLWHLGTPGNGWQFGTPVVT